MELIFNHLKVAHLYWKEILKPGDWAIDATCGTGQDTLYLAKLGGAGVISLDIQEEALRRAKKLLEDELAQVELAKVHLMLHSHATFPKLASEQRVKLVVYNLGYLPGGDKSLTTKPPSTLESIRQAAELIASGGALSITFYVGHPTGQEEFDLIAPLLAALPFSEWNICQHCWVNRPSSPILFLLQKK
jgi:SAM-dependent methyltransferase